MARLWSCGFELQSVTSGVEWDTTTGSPTISTTTKRSGNASLRCATTNARAFIRHQFSSGTTGYIYTRFWIYIVNYPDKEIAIASIGPASDYSAILTMSSTGVLRLYDYNDVVKAGPSSALSTNTWHCIEIAHQSSGNYLELKINNSSVGSSTTATLVSSTTFYVGMGANGYATETATGEFFIDDIAVNDSTGSYQNSWAGNTGKIVHLYPNAAGDNAMGDSGPSTGQTAYTMVDEKPTPNDDTDYWELINNNDILDVNCESSSTAGIGSSDTITLVQVGIRHRAETASAGSLTPRIKSQSSGTVTSGTNFTHNDTTWKTNGDAAPRIYKLTSYTDPQSGGSWTASLLDTMQIGVIAPDASPDMWITSLWALVEYVESTGNVTVSTNTQTFTSSQPSPTVSTIKNVTISGSVLELTASQPSSLVSISTAVALLSETISFSQIDPVIYGEAIIATASHSLSVSNPAVNIITEKNIIIELSTQTIIASSQNPTVSTVTHAIIPLDAQSALTTLPNPVIVTTTEVIVSPNAQTVLTEIPNPTITTTFEINVSPDTQSGLFELANPTVSTTTQVVISAGVQSMLIDLPLISVTTTKNTISEAGVNTAIFDLLEATITAVKNISYQPNEQSAVFSLPTPYIQAVINLVVELLSNDLIFSLLTPTVSLGATISPLTQTALLELPSPSIATTKNITIIPDAQTVLSNGSSPTVLAQKQVSITVDPAFILFSSPNIQISISKIVLADCLSGSLFPISPAVLSDVAISVNSVSLYSYINIPIINNQIKNWLEGIILFDDNITYSRYINIENKIYYFINNKLGYLVTEKPIKYFISI